MDRQVELDIQICSICQEAAKSVKVRATPLQPVPFPEQPWLKLTMDILGPFEKAPYDCRDAITLVDYYSKWPEVHFCNETTAITVIRFLVTVFVREGYPEEVICDNGSQFASRELEAFLQDCDIQIKHSSVYYPRANGQVEHFNRVLKSFIQVAALEQRPLRQAVTEYLGVYRCTPLATTARTPALLRASATLDAWGENGTARGGGSLPTCGHPTPEIITRTSAAASSAAQAPKSRAYAAQAPTSPAYAAQAPASPAYAAQAPASPEYAAQAPASPSTAQAPASPSAAQAPGSPAYAAHAHGSPAATQSAKSPEAVTQQRRVQPPRKRLPPERYGYKV
nr:uncharacterized protein K02A2.6-like [Rhipicephalus microplus]